ncbi:hypothetical protein D3C86_1791260 [compost metagenome]
MLPGPGIVPGNERKFQQNRLQTQCGPVGISRSAPVHETQDLLERSRKSCQCISLNYRSSCY